MLNMSNPFYNLESLLVSRDLPVIGSAFAVFLTHSLLKLKNNPGAGVNLTLHGVEYSLLLVPKIQK